MGEVNPYFGRHEDSGYALWPDPPGSSGHRLCHYVLGLPEGEYLESFDRSNLCDLRWSVREARGRAREILARGAPVVALGAKVARAFGAAFTPFAYYPLGPGVYVLPHPSGLCRLWNEPGVRARARSLLLHLRDEP